VSVNIVRKPFAVDFIQNDLSFVFKGDNIQVAGTKSVHKIQFIILRDGDEFGISINNTIYNFVVTKKTASNSSNINSLIIDNSGNPDLSDFVLKLNASYFSRDFDFKKERDTINFWDYISVISKVPGNNSIQSKNYYATAIYTLFCTQMTQGFERKFKDNYKIFVRLNFEYMNVGNKVSENSEEILLDVDESGYATLSLDILKGLSQKIDAPETFSQVYKDFILNSIIIKYIVEYAEMFGGELKLIKKSTDFYGINGLNSTSAVAVNRPDWDTIFSSNTIEKCNYVRLYGCHNNKTYHSHIQGKDYIYLSLFDVSKNKNYEKTVKAKIDLLYDDGVTQEYFLDSRMDLIIKNYSIVRVPTHIRVFPFFGNRNRIVKYTVSLWNSDYETGKISRTYVLKNVNNIYEFLLENKYGVLEYFFVENQKIKITTSGDSVVLNNNTDINITEKKKEFFVKTGIKNYEQLKILEQATASKNNYIIIKNKLIPINIIPESIEILDENKDLQESYFSFFIKDSNSEEVIVMLPGKHINDIDVISEGIWQDHNYADYSTKHWDDTDIFQEFNTESIWS